MSVQAPRTASMIEADASAVLVEAKLAPPRLRPGLLARTHLLDALDEGEGTALTLVAAPAGYGKTTMVRAWCAHRGSALAWVTLDARDNDPVQLWRYVATAVDRVRAGLGNASLRWLGVTKGHYEAPVDELMNGIAAFGKELILVLDDLEAVTSRESIASINYAVRHLPGSARMIVLTRADPGVHLAQLRARGELSELRARELAFTESETAQLIVDRAGILLEDRDVRLLHERTEGWPAALVLAGLWLRGVQDPRLAVNEFRADHRFVADYLTQEVLDALDDELREFLVRVSVLGRCTGEMCDSVLERSDSTSLLEELERRNLFTTRLEQGGWFRMHPLFGEFAGFHLGLTEPDAAGEIHRRAAEWLRSRHITVEALTHAATAEDFDLVADILDEYKLALIRSGSSRTLLHWVKRLSDKQLSGHPVLSVGAATAATIVGGAALERRRFLRIIDEIQLREPERCDALVQSTTKMVRALALEDGVAQAVWDGRSAVSIARAGSDDALVSSLCAYARALWYAGAGDEAHAAALEALDHPDVERRPPGHAMVRSTLALTALDRGQLETARTHAEKAKAIVGGIGSSRSWLGAHASAALGCVLAAEGALALAERELTYAERFFHDELPSIHHAWVLVELARVRVLRGRLETAGAAMSTARSALSEFPDTGRVGELAAAVEAELATAKRSAGGGELVDALSEAELAVLRLLESDLSVPEIASRMFLSPNTVRSHTRSIYRKLAVNLRAEAVARAGVLGLLAKAESPR
ncbi:MAG TPA: LuxR C-terminal-related transcriptional regulator [Gaiellaceae bacterium]|jgi:LuxR family maltose regulon positive regulatory protein|nr:LuxR C-terminal-related transcriptional regulator [Gaiellaceae bacterium]